MSAKLRVVGHGRPSLAVPGFGTCSLPAAIAALAALKNACALQAPTWENDVNWPPITCPAMHLACCKMASGVPDPAGPSARLALAGVVDGALGAVVAGVTGAVADALGEAEVTGELEVPGDTDGPADAESPGEAEVLGDPEVVEGAGEVADADGDSEADVV